MDLTFNNDFNDIKKYRILLQENIYLYFLPYKIFQNYLGLMKEEVQSLYPSLTQKAGSRIKTKDDEFIISRWLYKKVMETEFNSQDIILKKNPDSSIEFPVPYKLSLSHKKGDVLLGISSKYKGVGVDIERQVRGDLREKILNQDEYIFFDTQNIPANILIGLFFSFKESIFKTLYPIVKKMLYFKDASVTKIDFDTKEIEARVFLDDADLEDKTVYGKFNIEACDSHTNIITLAWI